MTNERLTLKQKEEKSGFLNYYLQFSGKWHTIIQCLIEEAGNSKQAKPLADTLLINAMPDTVLFRPDKRGHIMIYSDATPSQFAA